MILGVLYAISQVKNTSRARPLRPPVGRVVQRITLPSVAI
jgi:hypothetical protein